MMPRSWPTAFEIPLEQISTRYIDFDTAAAVDEWGKLRHKPCVFLRDNLCSVYTQRPESCRTYPALTPDFRWTLAETIEGASICPIIYNTLIELLDRLDDFLYHSNPTLP